VQGLQEELLQGLRGELEAAREMILRREEELERLRSEVEGRREQDEGFEDTERSPELEREVRGLRGELEEQGKVLEQLREAEATRQELVHDSAASKELEARVVEAEQEVRRQKQELKEQAEALESRVWTF